MEPDADHADAVREAMQAHGAVVYSLCRRLLGDPALAEEIAQDTFVAFWRERERFDPRRGTQRAFLLAVARNKAIDLWRRREWLRRSELLSPEVAGSAPSVAADEVDLRQELRRALARLPHAQKEALFLAYFEGCTYREVARHLGLPEGTTKSRLRQGLAALRTTMTAENVDLAS